MIDDVTFEFFKELECDPYFTIHRSKCQRYDKQSGRKVTVEKETLTVEGIVKRLASREVSNEIGRTSRETIRVEWDRPLYTASSQDKTDADVIEWGGSMWRVIEVIPRDCTWRAIAVRQEEKDCHDAKTSDDTTGIHIIGGGRV